MKSTVTYLKDGEPVSAIGTLIDMLAVVRSERGDPKKFTIVHVGTKLTVGFVDQEDAAIQLCERIQQEFPDLLQAMDKRKMDRSKLYELGEWLLEQGVTILSQSRGPVTKGS